MTTEEEKFAGLPKDCGGVVNAEQEFKLMGHYQALPNATEVLQDSFLAAQQYAARKEGREAPRGCPGPDGVWLPDFQHEARECCLHVERHSPNALLDHCNTLNHCANKFYVSIDSVMHELVLEKLTGLHWCGRHIKNCEPIGDPRAAWQVLDQGSVDFEDSYLRDWTFEKPLERRFIEMTCGCYREVDIERKKEAHHGNS